MLWKKNKVIVIGDIILDQYYTGIVSRISPEAPIPVIQMKQVRSVLGGAANVANNIHSLGGKVALIGTIGMDEAGKLILSMLREQGIRCEFLTVSKTYHTNKKVRILGNQQQIARLDYFDEERPEQVEIQNMVKTCKQIIEDYDVVVLSDYAKGSCSSYLCETIITLCNYLGKIVLVDPKGINWDKYKGATLITPNLGELTKYEGISIRNTNEQIEKSCYSLYDSLNILYLLVTRSEQGMTLITRENKYEHVSSKAREVFDVSGAGDTIVSTLALFIESKFEIQLAMELANLAAGIVVGKHGTATVSIQELESSFYRQKESVIIRKILSMEQLMEQVSSWKQKRETIVVTNGCFDVFHKGHAWLLYTAAEYGSHLIVAMNSDGSVKRLKGEQRPINSQYDRAYVLAALACVDAVVLFEEDTPEKLLSIIQPDVLVKGGDYQVEDIVGREYAKRVELVSYIEGYSTTGFIEKIKQNKKIGKESNIE